MSFSKLDREKILNSALALLETEGLAGISLRRLAKSLDVGVASLYWHVRDKDELLAMMAEAIYLDCIRSVPDVNDGAEWLKQFGFAIWRAQSRIPDIRQLIAQSPIREERQNVADDMIVAKLSRLGLVDGDLALRSVKALVTGWTTLSSRTPARLDHDEEDIMRALDVVVDGLTERLARH